MFVVSLKNICLLSLASASVLQYPQSTNGLIDEISLPSNSTTILVSSNSSVSTSNFSTASDIGITCEKIFGIGLHTDSCVNALKYIPQNSRQLRFRERGSLQADVALPYRVLSLDGLCLIETFLRKPAVMDYATMSEIRLAAAGIIHQCVKDISGEISQGGLAQYVGKDQNLAVIVAAYKPEARCDGFPGPSPSSCRMLLGSMPASDNKQVFGDASFPNVGVKLPIRLSSKNGNCVLKVDTTRDPDTTDWYRIWGAAFSIDALCVRHGHRGIVSQLGDNGNLFVEMFTEYHD